jgi:hypothetical protein
MRMNDAEFQELAERVSRNEDRRKKSLLGRWTDEQLRVAAGWVMLALFIFLLWFTHHNKSADRDAIPSQAWSFGEPGE